MLQTSAMSFYSSVYHVYFLWRSAPYFAHCVALGLLIGCEFLKGNQDPSDNSFK